MIGQTIAATDDSFSWSPSVPLTDGEHSLSALAELDGETSLPSPLLPLEVYSSLPFDPMGVLIAYDMHGRSYTQRMRDANGCATLDGDLEMPIWVRPGTTFTVTVPMRSELLPATGEQSASLLTTMALLPQPVANDPDAPSNTVFIHNSNSQAATSVRIAEPIAGTMGMYTDFGTGASLNKIGISETWTIEMDAGYYDILFFSGSGNVVDRQRTQVGGSDDWNLDIQQNGQHTVNVYNTTNRSFTEMYYTSNGAIGGDFVASTTEIKSGSTFDIKLPYTQRDAALVMRDSDGGYYIHSTHPAGFPFGAPLSEDFIFTDTLTTVTLNYGGSMPLCRFNIIRKYDQTGAESDPVVEKRIAVDMLDLTGKLVMNQGDSLNFKLESGNYYIIAYDCEGNKVGELANASIKGTKKTFNLAVPCKSGKLKMGDGSLQSILDSVDLQCGLESAGFSQCTASTTVSASEVTLELCYTPPPPDEGNISWELLVGSMLIDPDGYVYNATQGINSKVTGATVTCEVYDEDYQAWSEWPADFYENQVNPQVTASDGYYAFFVPPGLYRVWANAPGYATHTSPEIQVVSEIVHYNIPLQPIIGPGILFLPMIVR